MQNYINLILDELDGDTPKEKFEALKKLQSERTTYWSKADHAHRNFKALIETPGTEPFHTILSALANTTNVKGEEIIEGEKLGEMNHLKEPQND